MTRPPAPVDPPAAPARARPGPLLGLAATLLLAAALPTWAFDHAPPAALPAARGEVFLAGVLLVSVASGLLAPARGLALLAPALMVGLALRLHLRHERFVESEQGVQFVVDHLLVGGLATLAASRAREALARRGRAGPGPDGGSS